MFAGSRQRVEASSEVLLGSVVHHDYGHAR
jgi:hypothetical protein